MSGANWESELMSGANWESELMSGAKSQDWVRQNATNQPPTKVDMLEEVFSPLIMLF